MTELVDESQREADVREIAVLPKQLEFLQAQEREVLYSGAFGAGKTRAVCLLAFMRASTRGAREGLCRKTLRDLRATTLRTLLEPDGDLPPVIPREAIEAHHKTDHTIRIRGGGEIYYFGIADETRLGSLNFSGVGIDEAIELSRDEWTHLRGRVRLNLGDRLARRIYAATNPSTPSHHLATRFGLAPGGTPAPGCRAVTTSTLDNPFLPDDYVRDLLSLDGVALKRYVHGQWCASDRLVYDSFSRDVHLVHRGPPWARIVVGVDAGYKNPAVLLPVGLDHDDRAHVIDEWYETGRTDPEIVEAASALHDRFANRDDSGDVTRHAIETFVVDPSAASLIALMRQAGLPVIEADNARQKGIAIVRSRLSVQGDGLPRLTIEPTATNTVREIESYENKRGADGNVTDDPVKANDHAMDALRYALAYVDGEPPIMVHVL